MDLARRLVALGFWLIGTDGTARRLSEAGIQVERVKKIAEGHPNLLDHMIDGNIGLVMNTPSGKGARTDEGRIRAAAVQHGVPRITTSIGFYDSVNREPANCTWTRGRRYDKSAGRCEIGEGRCAAAGCGETHR